ncbi:prepilin peptidase [Blastococcus tunisiensis]|uniref:Leader peptidase (Prepilin peptidase) / N-methyltransferase n=1 Tax=Blastococcus tunisiensis TaxID=1798228 RepID=A0A1I2G9T6_9ACTN|nr:prepilin peptidase [Blastococcus sp. DSM 46838]SFF13707.1 leader peptidase (prepilin peptidase) / N-methyltransferase [Blastococcus sp. DSM 46838]
MSVLPAVVLGVAGVLVGGVVGILVNRAAGRFPWPPAPSIGLLVERGATAVRPPAVELVSAGLFALLGLRFGWSSDLAAWAWFLAVALLLAVVDLREQLLPNRILLPGGIGSAVLLVLAAALDDGWPDLLRAAVAAAICFAVLLVMALLAPAGLGMGDVKLAGLLGLMLGWLGWPAVLLGFFAGFLLQALVGLVLLVLRRAGRRTELPFGPALLAGTFAAALASGGWAAL